MQVPEKEIDPEAEAARAAIEAEMQGDSAMKNSGRAKGMSDLEDNMDGLKSDLRLIKLDVINNKSESKSTIKQVCTCCFIYDLTN